jgi:hypothetical protein
MADKRTVITLAAAGITVGLAAQAVYAVRTRGPVSGGEYWYAAALLDDAVLTEAQLAPYRAKTARYRRRAIERWARRQPSALRGSARTSERDAAHVARMGARRDA